MFISFVHSFNKSFLSISEHMSGTVLDLRDTIMKREKSDCFQGTYSGRRREDKQKNKMTDRPKSNNVNIYGKC